MSMFDRFRDCMMYRWMKIFGKIYEQKQQSMIYLLRKTIRQGLRRFSRFLNREINILELIFMR